MCGEGQAGTGNKAGGVSRGLEMGRGGGLESLAKNGGRWRGTD